MTPRKIEKKSYVTSGTDVMPTSEAPNDWNMYDSAFVENLGPSMTTMVPRSWKSEPCCFVTSISICSTDSTAVVKSIKQSLTPAATKTLIHA